MKKRTCHHLRIVLSTRGWTLVRATCADCGAAMERTAVDGEWVYHPEGVILGR